MALTRSGLVVSTQNSASTDLPQHPLLRTADFWRRVSAIYLGYKVAKVKATYLSWRGHSQEEIKQIHWQSIHEKAGQDMYQLCVDMRGFLIKAGQFIGARPDFVPEPICEQLRKLQDDVPPMPPEEVEAALKRELRIRSLGDVFEWIDLEKPLGSASIAQVHKAKLRRYVAKPSTAFKFLAFPVRACRALFNARSSSSSRSQAEQTCEHIVQHGETSWDVANTHGVSLTNLRNANRDNKMLMFDALVEGDAVQLPPECLSNRDVLSPEEQEQRVLTAVKRANIAHYCPKDDVVAVKVQYGDALGVFMNDLKNLRGLAGFLSKSDLAFDLVSAVDELSGQVKLEFDFQREARVMDQTNETLKGIRSRVVVPHSIPGLVTNRVLVMSCLDGIPLTQLSKYVKDKPLAVQKAAFKRIISRVSEAYGHMMLSSGLFHADAHPGNIMVLPKGVVGLIDYGQSKQLTDRERLLFARLVVALAEGNEEAISDTMGKMGIETTDSSCGIRAKLGTDMFGTAGKLTDPFGPDSLLKKVSITDFPKQFFLVLRVVQLIRGLASRMDIEFSTAQQWKPLALKALKQTEDRPPSEPVQTAKFYGI